MQPLYARSRKAVQDSIVKYGGPAIITRTEGGYDDEGNPIPVTTSTPKKIRGIYRDASFANAGSYLAGKASLLIDYTYEPEPQDTVTMGGETWTIDSVVPVKPDGVKVISYTLVLE